jgi:hypothetical protein
VDSKIFTISLCSKVVRGNVLEGKVPMDMDRNWVASSLAVDLDKIESGLGLDACMAIKYSSFGAQLMLTIGLLATVGLPWATRVFLAFRTVICCMLRGLERVAVVSVCLKFRGY